MAERIRGGVTVFIEVDTNKQTFVLDETDVAPDDVVDVVRGFLDEVMS